MISPMRVAERLDVAGRAAPAEERLRSLDGFPHLGFVSRRSTGTAVHGRRRHG